MVRQKTGMESPVLPVRVVMPLLEGRQVAPASSLTFTPPYASVTSRRSGSSGRMRTS